MGSLNPVGRTIESAARFAGTGCAGALVAVGVIGCARADSITRQAKAAESGNPVRNLCVIFNVLGSLFFDQLSYFLSSGIAIRNMRKQPRHPPAERPR